jgi:hypothetical protein
MIFMRCLLVDSIAAILPAGQVQRTRREIVKQFHEHCHGFKDSNDGTPIPPCMGYRIGADENPFGTGEKEEL